LNRVEHLKSRLKKHFGTMYLTNGGAQELVMGPFRQAMGHIFTGKGGGLSPLFMAFSAARGGEGSKGGRKVTYLNCKLSDAAI